MANEVVPAIPSEILAVMKKTMLVLAVLAIALNGYAADSDYAVDENGVITKYSGWDTEVVIPDTINGKKITGIGMAAFKNAELTSVTIPEGITRIGPEAFMENKLTRITIPGTVKVIEGGAFYGNNLSVIVLSEGVEVVSSEYMLEDGGYNNGAFDGNKAGLTITLPASIRVFESGLGGRATAILAANINADFSEVFVESDDYYASESIFYQYIANDRKAGTYTPNPVDYGSEAGFRYNKTPYGAVLTFYNGGSTRVRIPAEIGGIPVKAMYGGEYGVFNGQLDAVQIPESVSYIGRRAFSGASLASVTIPAGVTYIGDRAFIGSDPDENGDRGGNKLTSVTIPAGVTYIGDGAFQGNALTSLTIPDKVVYIGNNAFSGNKLTSVTIPPSVKWLGENPIIQEYVGLYGDSVNRDAQGVSIVIGANVDVASNFSSGSKRNLFKRDYDKNGRKAGRYTYVVDSRGYGS